MPAQKTNSCGDMIQLKDSRTLSIMAAVKLQHITLEECLCQA